VYGNNTCKRQELKRAINPLETQQQKQLSINNGKVLSLDTLKILNNKCKIKGFVN
jgi:hypothetical protein